MVYINTNKSNTHADPLLGSRWAQMWVHMWALKLVRFLVYVTKGNINDQLFEQKQGTTMGTRMAPNYVIIFMHYLETNFLTSYPKQPKIWLRFIDNVFMILKYGEQQLRMFLEVLNKYHPTIKFTHTLQ